MTLALFLPTHADAGWRWLRVADGIVAGRGEGWPAIDDEPVVAIAPAEAATLHWAELPDRSLAQATAAARLLVAEASASPAGDLHVAVGREDNAAERPIAVVEQAAMARWLAALAAEGVDPAALIPAPMLLPRPAEGWLRAELGGEGVVRGPTSGFADEARLTALVTGGAVPETIGRAALDTAIARAVADPPLDLRQGAFARRRRRRIDWALVRRLAVMIGLILLVTLGIDLVRIMRTSLAADAAEARAEALARTVLPAGQAGDAGRLLDERVAGVRGPGAGFSRTAAAAYAAIRSVPGSELTGLAFESTGALRLSLSTDSEGHANDVKTALERAGFDVQSGVFQSGGGRLTGEMTVRAS